MKYLKLSEYGACVELAIIVTVSGFVVFAIIVIWLVATWSEYLLNEIW